MSMSEEFCKCGHYWSEHRNKDYDAGVAGSVPGRGRCLECDCKGDEILDATELEEG